jgi:hypothetical protein
MNRNFRSGAARALAALGLLVVLTVTTMAHAAGTFKLKSTEVQEVSGGWHIFVDIGLPKAPSLPHMPMKFLFTKTVVYERALVDNHADPVINPQALVNQVPTIEDQDVDFADPSGKIFNRTRFDFSLARTRGYEAGEYKVQLRTSDGVEVGSTVRLVLKGDNPVVDRRAMNFGAKDSNGIKKVDNGVDAGQVAKNDSDENSTGASTEVSASGSATPFIPNSAYEKTPEEEVKTRPAGCGCAIPGLETPRGAIAYAGLSVVLLVVVGARRRRSRDTSRPKARG